MTIEVICHEPVFVSVYRKERFYGGPEEGGWYGTDMFLERSVQVKSKTLARELKARWTEWATGKTKDARLDWSNLCQRELDAAEAKLIDPLSLPEPNLPDEYIIHIETKKGSLERRGSRQYE